MHCDVIGTVLLWSLLGGLIIIMNGTPSQSSFLEMEGTVSKTGEYRFITRR